MPSSGSYFSYFRDAGRDAWVQEETCEGSPPSALTGMEEKGSAYAFLTMLDSEWGRRVGS